MPVEDVVFSERVVNLVNNSTNARVSDIKNDVSKVVKNVGVNATEKLVTYSKD